MDNTRISTEALMNVIASDYIPVIEADWRGIKVTIKRHLSLEDTLTFVENVVSNCFDAETGEYRPEIKDFVLRCAIMEYYANFTLPEDIYERFDAVYSMDAVGFIVDHIDMNHFKPMLEAIDKKIENRAQSNIEALTKQMNEVVAGLDGIERGMSGLFDGIDKETISMVAGAVAEGGFDEKKIVSEVIRQKSGE